MGFNPRTKEYAKKNIVKQPFPFVLLQGGREEKELQRLGEPGCVELPGKISRGDAEVRRKFAKKWKAVTERQDVKV